MARLLMGACAVMLLAGCVEASASSRPATQICGSDRTSDGRRLQTPPVPLVRASRDGDRIRVEYRILARPVGCVPDAILVTVNSVDKLDNVGPSASNGLIRLSGAEGTVELKLPPLDLPPYEVRASTLTPAGARSDATIVPVPESGGYCRRKASAPTCIRRAQAKFERCLRGEAPRMNCPDYVWRARPLIPYEPVRGVTRAALERSFEQLAQETEHGGSAFESVQCSSTRRCVVTWRGHDGIFRARFEISGYRQRPACWVAQRRAVLAGTTRLRHLIADRQRACVDWEWNR